MSPEPRKARNALVPRNDAKHSVSKDATTGTSMRQTQGTGTGTRRHIDCHSLHGDHVMFRKPRSIMPAAAFAAILLFAGHGLADVATPYPGTKVIKTGYTYAELVERVQIAVKKNKMGIVARASATLGAKSIGETIAGNMVVMVFRPDFAIRMLKASVPAGIEAPLRLYITEGRDGKATLTYRKPSAVFAVYKNGDLDKMAAELDAIFAGIEQDAVGR
jgi:uncharacterized protein (DUF302 family)